MGSPEKPIDVEMGDMDETQELNPPIKVEDGKVKEEEEEERFTGLKKEELLEISSQRQWVIARWVLFVIFWLVWVGMLVGAIIIVVQAPRCKKEPSPPWFQDTVVYQADVRKFAKDFEGMTEHLPYIEKLNAKTLTVCHAHEPENPVQVIGGQDTQFKELVAKAHEMDEGGLKVVVDLRIDVASVTSPNFTSVAVKNCAGEGCELFVWKANGTDMPTDDGSAWKYHDEREEYYKVSGDDETMAFLNYPHQDAKDYLGNLLKQWIAYGADGFQLRDLGKISSSEEVVEYLRTLLLEKQTSDENEENKRVNGLFLISSSPDVQASLFGAESNDTEAPVVINSQLSMGLKDEGTGDQIKSIITAWRNSINPNIGAYAINTMDLAPLASRLSPNHTAALTLLTMALPGVPVIKSGDESLLESDTFEWPVENKKGQNPPTNSSSSNIAMVQSIGDMRVSKFRSRQSLRWDDRNAKFEFYETGSPDVVAFTRVWDTKPTILVLSNLSQNNVTAKIEPKEGEPSTAEVLVSSNPSIAEKKEYKFKEIELLSGMTLVLEVKDE